MKGRGLAVQTERCAEALPVGGELDAFTISHVNSSAPNGKR